MMTESDRSGNGNLFLGLLVVAAGYYTMARLSLHLTIPPDFISALWLPNAVLLACLLLQPVTRWPLFLLVGMVAEIAADVPAGISWRGAVGFAVGDWLEVLIAAGLCRRFVQMPQVFTDVRPLLGFLGGAAVVAPAISAFLGAIVTGIDGSPVGFWTRWQRWATGDMVTHLIFTPFLLVWLGTEVGDLRRRVTWGRAVEIMAVTVISIATATLALGARSESVASLPAVVYLPLPGMLWIALRFGTRGLLTAGAFFTILAVWNASRGFGPFTGLSPAENVLNLQLFVTISMTPLLILAVDVEHRKAAERELARSEEKYRYFYHSLYDVHYQTDADGIVLAVSPAIRRIAGYEVAEVIGRQLADFYVDPAARLDFLEKIAETGYVENYEVALRASDGGVIWASTNARVLRDGDGLIRGVEGVTRDITEIKRAQLDRQELQNQLLRAQKMEAIGTLAGGIAHDFNNLLMGIQGRAELIKDDTGPGHPAREHVEGIEQHVRSAAGLTRQLLGFARGGKYEARPTNLNDLIVRACGMFGRTRKEVAIHQDLQPDLWSVSVDQGQIEQVLLNIFLNAWHAMLDGGDLTVVSRNRTYESSDDRPFSLPAGRYVRVAVTDTGMGMDPDVQARVFDPFFTTKAKERGTGLGLAAAYGIVKNHGGIIDVSSERGVGSTFTIWLPATERLIAGADEIGDREVLQGAGTVLLIDDEVQILAVAELMLRRLGYETLTATGGEQAVAIYTAHRDRIDVVLLDMIMPGLSGGETFDRLRTVDPEVTVVLSSGYSLDETAAGIMDRGCAGFIQKPYTMDELSRKLHDVRA